MIAKFVFQSSQGILSTNQKPLSSTCDNIVAPVAIAKTINALYGSEKLLSGTKRMKPTSKNTGMAIIKVVNVNASEDLFSPNVFNKCEARALAPPDDSNTCPKIAPRPTNDGCES